MQKVLLLACFIACLFSCQNTNNNSADGAAASVTVYHGGDIITMEGDSASYAEAVAVKDGKILFVGNKAEAIKAAGEGYASVDLQGKTLVPGFFDGHAHFFGFGAQAVTANLLASPDGTCNDIPSLQQALKDWKKTQT